MLAFGSKEDRCDFPKAEKAKEKGREKKGVGGTTQGSHKPAKDQLVLQAPCRPIYRPEATRKKLLPAGVQPLPIVPVNQWTFKLKAKA